MMTFSSRFVRIRRFDFLGPTVSDSGGDREEVCDNPDHSLSLLLSMPVSQCFGGLCCYRDFFVKGKATLPSG